MNRSKGAKDDQGLVYVNFCTNPTKQGPNWHSEGTLYGHVHLHLASNLEIATPANSIRLLQNCKWDAVKVLQERS